MKELFIFASLICL